jgi:iron complex transport system ATP-binding protein
VASRAFLETLRGLARDGKTIVFVTHHLHEIIPEVERVVLLREGRVYLDGTRPSALSTHHLSAAFGAPVEVRDAGGGYVTMAMPDAADGVTSGR